MCVCVCVWVCVCVCVRVGDPMHVSHRKTLRARRLDSICGRSVMGWALCPLNYAGDHGAAEWGCIPERVGTETSRATPGFEPCSGGLGAEHAATELRTTRWGAAEWGCIPKRVGLRVARGEWRVANGE